MSKIRYTYIAKGQYWRFRHPTTGDCPLPGAPGEPEFHARYGELLAKVKAKPKLPDAGTWAAIIARYRKSAEFNGLAEATRNDYDGTLDILSEKMGDEPFALTTRTMVKAVRDDFAGTPRKAHKVQQMASGLYTWADQAGGIIPEGFNPVTGLKKLRNPDATEYVCWSEYEFDLFVAGAIEPMIVAATIARYTGQRAKDIARMTWKQFQNDIVRVRQAKTGAPLDIACPARLKTFLTDLRTRLDAKKSRGVMIVTNAKGLPYNANSLSSAIGREVAKLAEGPDFPADRSIHGLRYMAGAELEESGCTIAEVQAVLGHHAYQMAMKYATQRLRSRNAAAKRDGHSQ